MRQNICRRGFSLVEVTIILVIVGLITGGIIVPTFALQDDDIYDAEERRLEIIKAAIIGYAIRHQTPRYSDETRKVFIIEPGSDGILNRLLPRAYELPTRVPRAPGDLRSHTRPYLPCPDIIGDGNENRVSFDLTGYLRAGGIVTNTIVIENDPNASTRNALQHAGQCASVRGVLPWRTLGVPPSDYWGNMYTYEVDVVWSDADVGFNQNSVIDTYDPRDALRLESFDDKGLYNRRKNNTFFIGESPFPDNYAGDSILPFFTINLGTRPLVICGSGHCGHSAIRFDRGLTVRLDLVAGRQADAEFELIYRQYEQFNVVEGVPFAVVSHGKNGHGAVSYQNLLNINFDGIDNNDDSLICNYPANTTSDNIFIRLNGYFDVPPAQAAEAYNFPVLGFTRVHQCFRPEVNFGPGPMHADDIRPTHGFMSYRPRSNDFDDVMTWMTQGELINIMHKNRVLPTAVDFPVLRPN